MSPDDPRSGDDDRNRRNQDRHQGGGQGGGRQGGGQGGGRQGGGQGGGRQGGGQGGRGGGHQGGGRQGGGQGGRGGGHQGGGQGGHGEGGHQGGGQGGHGEGGHGEGGHQGGHGEGGHGAGIGGTNSMEQFMQDYAPRETSEHFGLVSDKLLAIQVNGSVWTKAGSMTGYEGDLSFTGKSSAEGGISGFIKSKASGESTPVMKVEGRGTLYVADQGKKVQTLDLGPNESISVNGEDILAFEESVNYEISTIGSMGAAAAGGLTNVFLTGPGMIAITTHGDPLVLTPPVMTDPDATVAWSADLSPSINSNRSLSDAIGTSSGETYQMAFQGQRGFVIVQPYEEGAQGAHASTQN